MNPRDPAREPDAPEATAWSGGPQIVRLLTAGRARAELRLGAALKRDAFGAVHLAELRQGDTTTIVIARNLRAAHLLLRPIAALLALRERRALARLAGIAGVPHALAKGRGLSVRSHLAGQSFAAARPGDPALYAAARRLLHQIHRRGITHNDTHKAANWIVCDDGQPALIDFQLAWHHRRRSGFQRLCALEDLRHLTKQRRRFVERPLSAIESRLLAKKSWIARAYLRVLKPIYLFTSRRLLRTRDNEGLGPPKGSP